MEDYRQSGLGTALAVGASLAAAAIPYPDSEAAPVDTDRQYHESQAEVVETVEEIDQEALYDSIVKYEIDTGDIEGEPWVTGTAKFMYIERDSVPEDSLVSYETSTECKRCTPDKVMGEGFSKAFQEKKENGAYEETEDIMFDLLIGCSDFIAQKAIYKNISPKEQEFMQEKIEDTIEDLEEDTGLDLAIDGDSIVLED